MKKVLKIIGIILACIAVIFVGFFAYATIVEYNPDSIEEIEAASGSGTISKGDELSIMTFNIGYAGYDQDEDFFMDGGKKVRQKSADAIKSNLSGIAGIIKEQDADVTFIQEVDIDSHRSFYINERSYLESSLGEKSNFAYNFKVNFVPYPIPPIGKVNSGLATFTNLNVSDASRISLPVSFSWPVRTCNLKRCILEERIPIEGSDNELVLLNFHLEAYDDGDGKKAQTEQLKNIISEEYERGNYVIAGGDFNQTFDCVEQPVTLYPDDWMPGYLSSADLPEGFSFAVADNASTCRSLGRAYIDAEQSQAYIIDGFIVSDNLDIESVQVIDEEFMYSDHNPVRLDVKIK